MRVLMIDAGPNPESTTYIALNEIRGQLQKEGVECEIVHTGGQNVEGCRFCNSCKKTGRCVLDDCLNPGAGGRGGCLHLCKSKPLWRCERKSCAVDPPVHHC